MNICYIELCKMSLAWCSRRLLVYTYTAAVRECLLGWMIESDTQTRRKNRKIKMRATMNAMRKYSRAFSNCLNLNSSSALNCIQFYVERRNRKTVRQRKSALESHKTKQLLHTCCSVQATLARSFLKHSAYSTMSSEKLFVLKFDHVPLFCNLYNYIDVAKVSKIIKISMTSSKIIQNWNSF